MSSTLFALVILQGTSLTFSPGYTTAAECLQQYKGPNVACFAYDAGLSTWTAFFKLPEGGFRTVGKVSSEDECKRYIGAFKDGIPTACRQLAMPVTCNVACVAPVQPPAPTGSIPAAPPPAKPEPNDMPPFGSETPRNDDVQLAGGHYHYGRPLFFFIKDDSTKVAEADKPYIEPRAEPAAQPTKPIAQQELALARAKRVARRLQKPQQFDPIGALVSLLTPRDW